jgi:hypothetical protein
MAENVTVIHNIVSVGKYGLMYRWYNVNQNFWELIHLDVVKASANDIDVWYIVMISEGS